MSLTPYAGVPPIRPFSGWGAAAPTKTLPWYHAYNQTKHEREAHLSSATVKHCIEAVAASIVLHSVRFGPFGLYHQHTSVASLVTHLFTLALADCDPATFYVPLVEPPTGSGQTLSWGDSQNFTLPWIVEPLII